MLKAIALLFLLQCGGDLLVARTSLPIPGMVIGLVLLLLFLLAQSRGADAETSIPEDLSRTAKTLHDHFGLLFVPAGVGVMADAGRLAAHGAALLLVVLLSTTITMSVGALIVAVGSLYAARMEQES